jgi:hypothetical protein
MRIPQKSQQSRNMRAAIPPKGMGRPNDDRGRFVRVVWDDVVVSGSEDV